MPAVAPCPVRPGRSSAQHSSSREDYLPANSVASGGSDECLESSSATEHSKDPEALDHGGLDEEPHTKGIAIKILTLPFAIKSIWAGKRWRTTLAVSLISINPG
jgi:hypothetical protein